MRTSVTSSARCFAVLALALGTAAAQTPLLILNGLGQPKSFGADAAAVGDWDGDGVGDIAIGIPQPIPGDVPPGTVRVVSGKDASVLAVFSGTAPKEQFGELVAGVGDVDGDGAVDIAVGSAPFIPEPPTRVQVFSGASGQLLYTQPLPWLGLQSLAGVGDTNGDGYADVAEGGFDCTGVIGSSDNGDVKLLSGASGALLYKLCGDGGGDHFASDLAAGGDVNADGYADFIVGASELDNFSTEGNGYVRVVSGLDGATLFTFEGQPVYDNGFGWTVDSAGDVNGDGRPDILIGAQQEKVDGLLMGSASVYSGLDGVLLHHVLGTLVNKQFGFLVAGPGDVDGDGLADFAVATAQLDAPGPPQSGYVVYSGADATPLHDVPLGPSASYLGTLQAAGDLDADGTPDLLMITDELSTSSNSSVTVRSGAPVLLADLGFALPGSQGTPHLQIEGILKHGMPLTLSVTTAPPLAPLFLVLGNAAAPVPFHGGMLVPVPQIIVTLATDAAGALTAGTTSPALPSGMQLVVQGWLPDPPAPTHFAATNAVVGVAP